MERHERDLNRQAIDGLTNLFQHGIRLRADSIRELAVSRRALKIALETLKEVSPEAHSKFCVKALEQRIIDW